MFYFVMCRDFLGMVVNYFKMWGLLFQLLLEGEFSGFIIALFGLLIMTVFLPMMGLCLYLIGYLIIISWKMGYLSVIYLFSPQSNLFHWDDWIGNIIFFIVNSLWCGYWFFWPLLVDAFDDQVFQPVWGTIVGIHDIVEKIRPK